MKPITMFDTHFKTAQAMLKVYQLLDSEEDLAATGEYVPRLREMMSWETHEPLTLLLNDMFLGAVRNNANVPADFFGKPNLALLLRQAVASSCTAMDVFFPSLLEAHLPRVIKVRQQNFLPRGGEVKNLFEDFKLEMPNLVSLLEEPDARVRRDRLTRMILRSFERKTFSNADNISAAMMLLGIEKPWMEIAAKAGVPENALRDQIRTVTKRRNDIVHRGDRLLGGLDDSPQSIDFAWTKSHVNAVESVANACDELARKSIRDLTDGTS